jgi:hypothetical protein
LLPSVRLILSASRTVAFVNTIRQLQGSERIFEPP